MYKKYVHFSDNVESNRDVVTAANSLLALLFCEPKRTRMEELVQRNFNFITKEKTESDPGRKNKTKHKSHWSSWWWQSNKRTRTQTYKRLKTLGTENVQGREKTKKKYNKKTSEQKTEQGLGWLWQEAEDMQVNHVAQRSVKQWL